VADPKCIVLLPSSFLLWPHYLPLSFSVDKRLIPLPPRLVARERRKASQLHMVLKETETQMDRVLEEEQRLLNKEKGDLTEKTTLRLQRLQRVKKALHPFSKLWGKVSDVSDLLLLRVVNVDWW
jgi:hypothetical protein